MKICIYGSMLFPDGVYISRIAAPMVGGMVSATILTLAVIPAVF